MSLFCTDCGSIFEEELDICPECGFDLKEKADLDDKTIDKMLYFLKRDSAEIDRLIELRKERIKEEQEAIKKLEQKKQDKIDKLKINFETFMRDRVDKKMAKKTTTQYSYKLIEGTLALTKPTFKIEKQKDINLEDARLANYKKVSEDLDWAKLKKELSIVEGTLYKDGEPFQVDGFEAVSVEPDIKIKFID